MTSLAFVLSLALTAEVVPPQVLDDRLQVQFVAAEPDVRRRRVSPSIAKAACW
jgi:hypothetical protein